VKKTLMLVPLVFLLMFASTMVPVLAAKHKAEKVEYTLLGRIYDGSKGISGIVSLSFSGGVKAPDYESSYSGEGPIEESGDDYYEEFWSDEEGNWRAQNYYWYSSVGYDIYSGYQAIWDSSQPAFNGKLVAIWEDGSTTTFTAGLSLLGMVKSSSETTRTVEATFGWRRVVYWLDKETAEWVFDREEEDSFTYGWSGTIASTTLSMEFEGRIQSKGGRPLQGTLSLFDYKEVYDGSGESRHLSLSGQFGPYNISSDPRIIPM